MSRPDSWKAFGLAESVEETRTSGKGVSCQSRVVSAPTPCPLWLDLDYSFSFQLSDCLVDEVSPLRGIPLRQELNRSVAASSCIYSRKTKYAFMNLGHRLFKRQESRLEGTGPSATDREQVARSVERMGANVQPAHNHLLACITIS
jgi:hypothetical protein